MVILWNTVVISCGVTVLLILMYFGKLTNHVTHITNDQPLLTYFVNNITINILLSRLMYIIFFFILMRNINLKKAKDAIWSYVTVLSKIY